MEKEALYKQVQKLMKELDKQFEKEVELKSEMDKAESLNTYLFSNPPELLKKSKKVTAGLVAEIVETVNKLKSLGYAIDGKTYELVQIDENKMSVSSAKYGFVVQY